MNSPNKIAMVGAGGIGCNLAPMLSRMAPLVIIDADTYEPANVGRQFPALQYTDNKALVLTRMVQPHTLHPVLFIPEFVKDIMICNLKEWAGVDLIIAGVDNNPSRRILIELADDLGIPCILAGNSHAHGEAHLFVPGVYNPLDHFAFAEEDPAPWSCNSDKMLEEHPQTAVANILAAGCAMHLLHSWQTVLNPLNAVVHSRHDALSSTYSRAKDMISSHAPQLV
jgi:molybdopterin/thiamine biosynthesis adenylyltransferase